MTISAIKAGAAFVEISARDQKLRDALENNRKRLAGFVANVAKVGVALAAATAIGSLKRFADVGDMLDKMSLRTGVTVEALSELKFAAEQSGAGIQAIETGIRGMNRLLLDFGRGTATAADTMRDLGISFGELQGLSVEGRFEVFAEALSTIEDQSRRSALAMKVFGRSGTELLPLLNQGAAGISKLRNEAQALGLSMSTEQATAAAELTDAWNRMVRASEALLIKVGAELAPVMTDVANIVALVASRGSGWVATLVKTAAAVTSVIVVLKAVTIATQAYTRTAAIAQALTGPKGWIALAASLATVAAASYAIDTAFDAANASMQEAIRAAEDQGNAVRKLGELEQKRAERQRHIRRNERDLAESAAELTRMMEQQRTAAERLNDQLNAIEKQREFELKIIFGGGDESDFIDPKKLDTLRDRLIDAATGFGTEMQKVRDEIGLLNGTLTDTEIKLRNMREAGLPEAEVAQLTQAYEDLEAARAQAAEKEQRAEARRQRQEQRQQETDALQSRLTQLQEAAKKPAELLADMLKDLRDGVRAGMIDRETAAALFRERQEDLFRDMQSRLERQQQAVTSESSQNLRSSQGGNLITRVLNSQATTERQLVNLNRQTARNTARLVEIERGRRRAKV